MHPSDKSFGGRGFGADEPQAGPAPTEAGAGNSFSLDDELFGVEARRSPEEVFSSGFEFIHLMRGL
jgi:hypothetical protein